jgi:hypothetical protein
MFGDFGGDFGDGFGGGFGGGGSSRGRRRRVCGVAPRWGAERGAPQRRACGDGAGCGRRRAAGARPSRAQRAGRPALARVDAHARCCVLFFLSSVMRVCARRSGGSTCYVGRMTTARYFAAGMLYAC